MRSLAATRAAQVVASAGFQPRPAEELRGSLPQHTPAAEHDARVGGDDRGKVVGWRISPRHVFRERRRMSSTRVLCRLQGDGVRVKSRPGVAGAPAQTENARRVQSKNVALGPQSLLLACSTCLSDSLCCLWKS